MLTAIVWTESVCSLVLRYGSVGVMDAAAELRPLANGFQVSQALHAAAVKRISDALAVAPRTVHELAAMVGAHDGSLHRLLRALVSVGVYSRDEQGRFANTELGQALRSDTPRSVAGWAALVGRPHRTGGADLPDELVTCPCSTAAHLGFAILGAGLGRNGARHSFVFRGPT